MASQRDKHEKGSTPLHLGASLNGWPHAGFLSTRFPQVWPGSEATARLLLDANESTAYQADDEGSYPIHVAAWSNSLGVVKTLLERCPDCVTLRDGKGQTFLHVAAEKSCHDVVRYACRQMPKRLSSMILNVQDSNGDTASAARCCPCWEPCRLQLPVSESGGAPHGGGRPELFSEKHMPKRESQQYTEATQMMSIVSALIATVTFASAFTFPGGYRADGEPVFAAGKQSYAFNAFILADTLAFICSISSTCALLYTGLPAMDISIRFWYLSISSILQQRVL
ncbi:unnamed protein product [Miscanthus lutarioriparius]|uniref:PGG domain-containing protein n=1 Tax=Miscanthus lutarioriparius TaxID=422564 RepID=A0A811S6J4_9POAL|nr:unnamed protein product [Miscanthus lutarioriparius]